MTFCVSAVISSICLWPSQQGNVRVSAVGALVKSAASEGGQIRSLFTVGFCFGGALSYFQSTTAINASGVIGFYGWPLGLKRWPDRPKPIDAAAKFKAPVLSLYGGADEGIPEPDRKAFSDALKKSSSVSHEEHVYPGAPHSFFDRKYEEFKDASTDAWTRVRSFISSKTK